MKTGVLAEMELSESPLTKSQSLVVAKNQNTSLDLVMPCRRKVLMEKLDNFKVANLTAKEFANYSTLLKKNTYLFERLCWNKMGISEQQINRLQVGEQEELALMIYEKSKVPGLFQTVLLVCIPIVGWILLPCLLNPKDMPDKDDWRKPLYNNLRYFWWYRKMKKSFGKNFYPKLELKPPKQLQD
ncbi:MAG TPA: hypothetical protein VI978_02165 [Candidatus Paceibacterota bacterium]